MIKPKPCPFCGGKVAVVICDDEGNLHDDDYLFNPYSGVGYKLRHTHELNLECPIAEYEEDEGTVGVYIYDTAEDAIEAWNKRLWEEGKNMTKHFCDLCGKDINILQETYKVSVDNNAGIPYMNDPNIVDVHEICPDCANRIC